MYTRRAHACTRDAYIGGGSLAGVPPFFWNCARIEARGPWGTLGTMTDLPVPEPVRAPPLTDDDVRAALMPIVPGWYRSADLLPRFNAWCREQGRDPVTAKTLGQAISAHFTATKRYATGHVAVWFLDEATLTHRNWFKARRD